MLLLFILAKFLSVWYPVDHDDRNRTRRDGTLEEDPLYRLQQPRLTLKPSFVRSKGIKKSIKYR